MRVGGAMPETSLSMFHFLEVVAEHTANSRDVLLAEGFHHKVVTAKAEKAARLRYTQFGVVADRPWLTERGRAFLVRHRKT